MILRNGTEKEARKKILTVRLNKMCTSQQSLSINTDQSNHFYTKKKKFKPAEHPTQLTSYNSSDDSTVTQSCPRSVILLLSAVPTSVVVPWRVMSGYSSGKCSASNARPPTLAKTCSAEGKAGEARRISSGMSSGLSPHSSTPPKAPGEKKNPGQWILVTGF